MPTPAAKLALAISEYAITVHGRAPRQATMQIDLGSDGSAQAIFNEHLFGGSGESSDLSASDLAIIEVVNTLGPNERLTTEEIAAKSGYPNGGWLRGRIAQLARDGHFKSHGRRGYGPNPE